MKNKRERGREEPPTEQPACLKTPRQRAQTMRRNRKKMTWLEHAVGIGPDEAG